MKTGAKKHTSGQVKTTPGANPMGTKPQKISKKVAVKVVVKKKVSRASMPNVAGAETTPSRNKGGINQEMMERKATRMRQGL